MIHLTPTESVTEEEFIQWREDWNNRWFEAKCRYNDLVDEKAVVTAMCDQQSDQSVVGVLLAQLTANVEKVSDTIHELGEEQDRMVAARHRGTVTYDAVTHEARVRARHMYQERATPGYHFPD